MSLINLTLPTGEVAVQGKQVTFVAPCDSKTCTGLKIDGVSYSLVDAGGFKVEGINNVWEKDATLSVILDTTNKKAYVQNPVSAKYHIYGDTITRSSSEPTYGIDANQEETILFRRKDKDGNVIIQMPITKADNVEDLSAFAKVGGVVPITSGGTGATTAAKALTNLGLTATATELNYCDGVTSNIQTQINGKANSSHNHSASNITSGTLPMERGGTGNTTGLAASATKLATARTISLSGDATGETTFNGTADKDIAVTLANSGVTAGSYGLSANATPSYGSTFEVPYITVDAKGRVTSASTKTVKMPASDDTNIVVDSALSSTSINPVQNKVVNSALSAKAPLASPTFTGTPKAPTASAGTNTTQIATTAFVKTAVDNKTSVSGNAGTATKLETARTIALSGDVTGTATSFNGTANISIPTTIATMTGASASSAGKKGLVPAPSAGDNTKVLHGDGTWKKATGFESYWESSEQVEVGDIRVPTGRENSGLFLECVQAGKTGSTQPSLDSAVLANYSHVDRIGAVRWVYNIAEKDEDEILATGVKYSRSVYSALWDYVQTKPSLIISEAEWQAKCSATGGKFVPYFSSGDGSTDFRTPLLCGYALGNADTSKVGTFTEAGLPNITGWHSVDRPDSVEGRSGGAFRGVPDTYTSSGGDGDGGHIEFDASLSNPIYGKSDTVTPDTMNGVWVIKAFGIVVDSGNSDLKSVLSGIEGVSNRISTIESTHIHVVESYVSGTSWYRVWSDGWIEQGGQFTSPSSPSYPTYTGTFLKPFTSIPVRVVRTPMGFSNGDAGSYLLTIEEITTTGFYIRRTYATQTYSWYACGR